MHTMAQSFSCSPSAGAPPAALADSWPNNEAVVPQRLADLEQLYVAHHERVFRAAYRVTGSASDAEDVLQTVFLRILRNRHSFASVDDAGNYLYRAGLNAAVDLVRARRTAASEPLDDQGPPGSPWKPDRSHHPPELRDRLRDAVAQLHPTAAEMFVLRYFEGYDNAEVARLMDTSEGTVAVTLHRTRARLQKELGEIR